MIHRIQVKNFKSIRDIVVDLTPLTVIAGKSGAGKSNFIESIRLLRDTLVSGSFERDDWHDLYPARSIPTAHPNFTLAFSNEAAVGVFIYQLTFQRLPEEPSAGPSLVNELLMQNGETILHHADGEWVQPPAIANLPEPGQLLLGRFPTLDKTIIAFNTLTRDLGFYPNETVVEPAGERGSASKLIEILKNITNDLSDRNLREAILTAAKRINPAITSIELDNIYSPTQILVNHQFGKRSLALDFALESEGFRNVYQQLLALNQRPKKNTLLFEHPENGVDPNGLELLAGEYDKFTENKNRQIIATTHSNALLGYLVANQVRVVELDGFETKIKPYTPSAPPAVTGKESDNASTNVAGPNVTPSF